MSLKNVRLEVMQHLEKDVDSLIEKYLIPVDKIWQPTDFLPNSQSDNFIEEVKEIQEISATKIRAKMREEGKLD